MNTAEQVALGLTKPQARDLVEHVAHRDAHPTWTMLISGLRTSAPLVIAGCLSSQGACYDVTLFGREVAAILEAGQ